MDPDHECRCFGTPQQYKSNMVLSGWGPSDRLKKPYYPLTPAQATSQRRHMHVCQCGPCFWTRSRPISSLASFPAATIWWEPCASTALKPILSLLPNMPIIGRGPSGHKAGTADKVPYRANCTTVLDPKHKNRIGSNCPGTVLEQSLIAQQTSTAHEPNWVPIFEPVHSPLHPSLLHPPYGPGFVGNATVMDLLPPRVPPTARAITLDFVINGRGYSALLSRTTTRGSKSVPTLQV